MQPTVYPAPPFRAPQEATNVLANRAALLFMGHASKILNWKSFVDLPWANILIISGGGQWTDRARGPHARPRVLRQPADGHAGECVIVAAAAIVAVVGGDNGAALAS